MKTDSALAQVAKTIQAAVADRYVNVTEATEIASAIKTAAATMNSSTAQLADVVDKGLSSVVQPRYRRYPSGMGFKSEDIIDAAVSDATGGKYGFSAGSQVCGPFRPAGVHGWPARS